MLQSFFHFVLSAETGFRRCGICRNLTGQELLRPIRPPRDFSA
jgi:hypothetical protein